jgi:hypothetical protein
MELVEKEGRVGKTGRKIPPSASGPELVRLNMNGGYFSRITLPSCIYCMNDHHRYEWPPLADRFVTAVFKFNVVVLTHHLVAR